MEEREFLLIKEADIVQDIIVEFIYGHKMSAKLPKELKVRVINLLNPEVDKIYRSRKRKESED